MTKPRLRALVLTAGLGSRLRPLTAQCPKPLLPVLGRPLVSSTLDRLEAAGCDSVALNLHHLGETIREAFGDRHGEMPLVYSRERELLGTLGALQPLRDFLAEADYVLLVNGDSLCRWPLEELVDHHLESGAEATLLLSLTAEVSVFGSVDVDERDRIVGCPGFRPPGTVAGSTVAGEAGTRELVFAGAHVFSPSLIDSVAPGFAGIFDLYARLLEQGRHLQGLVSDTPWHDLGTPRRYLEAVRSWSPAGRSWLAPTARVSGSAEVKESVIEGGARVGPGSRCLDSLLMPGSSLAAGACASNIVLGSGASVPSRMHVADCLLTLRNAGMAPGSRILGENLVETPLDIP